MSDLVAQLDELKRRLAIDSSKLTEALVEQPTLYLAAREAVVECIAARDKCRHDLERYTAQHDSYLREGAANAGEKLTENRIAAMVAIDPGVVGWKHALNESNAMVGKAQAIADSYNARQWMLRELAQIHAPFERDRFGDGLTAPSP